MPYAFVVDKNKQPLAPCHPARARQLLRDGKAAVFRRYPFTIILKDREGGDTQPLEIEHIIPKSRGGSNRVTNLTLACTPCNTQKGAQTAAEFGHPNIQARVKRSLFHAAAVNATRWKLFETLQAFGFEVEVGTGGRTKFNRTKQGYPKTHWLDAACVGESGEHVFAHDGITPLQIHAKGHGSRQMCRVDKYGFPRTKPKQRVKRIKGFQTGDMVRTKVPSGKKQGIHEGRVAVRATGSCNVTTPKGTVQGINVKYLSMLHFSDGYSYLANKKGDGAPPHSES